MWEEKYIEIIVENVFRFSETIKSHIQETHQYLSMKNTEKRKQKNHHNQIAENR